jgi:hypothetical protein
MQTLFYITFKKIAWDKHSSLLHPIVKQRSKKLYCHLDLNVDGGTSVIWNLETISSVS